MKGKISKAKSIYQEEGLEELSREIRRFSFSRGLLPLQNKYFNKRYGNGEPVIDRDFDNLLLLDACRYDVFCEASSFDNSDIDRRITLGSFTPEFMERTFYEVQLHDTVYVTANPVGVRYLMGKEKPVFYDYVPLMEEWDPELHTIRPEVVKDAALQAADEYRDKRLIVHFIQPHTPFLGPTAEKINSKAERTVEAFDPVRVYEKLENKRIATAPYEEILQTDGIEPEDIRTAYRETLEIVLDEVYPLIEELPGKTVITSDHGEALGESLVPFTKPMWGHRGDLRTYQLCVVPWIEFADGERRDISADQPLKNREPDEDVVESKLEALGYL